MDSSHYFKTVKRFIQSHYSDKKSIADLNKLVRSDGCLDSLVDQVVNGAIVDYLIDIISPLNHKGNCFNPTCEELINFLTDEQFDLPKECATKLLEYLIHEKSALKDVDGRLCLIKRLVPNKLVQLTD